MVDVTIASRESMACARWEARIGQPHHGAHRESDNVEGFRPCQFRVHHPREDEGGDHDIDVELDQALQMHPEFPVQQPAQPHHHKDGGTDVEKELQKHARISMREEPWSTGCFW